MAVFFTFFHNIFMICPSIVLVLSYCCPIGGAIMLLKPRASGVVFSWFCHTFVRSGVI